MSQRPRLPPLDASDTVRRLIGGAFFGTGAVAAAALAVLFVALPSALDAGARAGAALAFLVLLVIVRRLDEPKAASMEALLREILIQSPQRFWLRFWPRG